MPMRKFLLFFAVVLFAAVPASAQNTLPTVQQPTGGQVTQIVVSGGNRSLFKIALPQWGGDADNGKQSVETASRDFVLSSMFQVLDPQSFTANLQAEGNSIDQSSWRTVGAEAVIKGYTQVRAGGALHIELKLFVVSRGPDAVLRKDYDVAAGNGRAAAHQFVNEVIKWFTGTPGSFGTRLVFSATTGRGQKEFSPSAATAAASRDCRPRRTSRSPPRSAPAETCIMQVVCRTAGTRSFKWARRRPSCVKRG